MKDSRLGINLARCPLLPCALHQAGADKLSRSNQSILPVPVDWPVDTRLDLVHRFQLYVKGSEMPTR